MYMHNNGSKASSYIFPSFPVHLQLSPVAFNFKCNAPSWERKQFPYICINTCLFTLHNILSSSFKPFFLFSASSAPLKPTQNERITMIRSRIITTRYFTETLLQLQRIVECNHFHIKRNGIIK